MLMEIPLNKLAETEASPLRKFSGQKNQQKLD